jgi:hypothetical protein
MRRLLFPIAFIGLLAPAAFAAEEPFGQERVETRPFRTPQKLRGHSHAGHDDHAGHGHEHKHGRTAERHDHAHGRGHPHGKGAHRHDHGAHGRGHAHGGAGHRHDHGAGDHRGGHGPEGHRHGGKAHDQGHDHGHGHAHGEGGHAHGVETENLFGFTLGSDTEEAGAKGVALENVGRIGKRGTYRGLGQKLEASFGATNDLSLSFSLLGDYHRLRNVPDFEDVSGRYAANGVGAEVRWRFLDRKTAPFGLTLHLEPSVARIDEVSGQAGRKLGSENKLIFDRELIPNTLFGAINLLYDVERMKERHNNFVAERAANAGVGAALTFRVTDDLFLGGEARYLRAYEGFGLRKWQGEAVYVGPTLFARFLKNGWISAAWNYQVNGRTAVNRAERAEAVAEFNGAVAEALAAVAEPPEGEQPAPLQLPSAPAFARRGHKDLVNFERHQLRLKVGFEF